MRHNLTVRVDDEHRELMRETNKRLHSDPGFADALKALVKDPKRSAFVPSDVLEARFTAIERRLAELEKK